MIMISSASESLTSIGTIGTSWRLASCAARQRRSPAMISKRSCDPFTGRTTIGWITPCCLTEAASSPSSASENVRRGLRGFGFRNSIGTLRLLRGRSGCAVSPPTSPIRLARPRPIREPVLSAIATSLDFTQILHAEFDWPYRHSGERRQTRTRNPEIGLRTPSRFRINPLARIVRNDAVASMRPQLALALDHFRRQLQILFATDAFEVVDQHGLAVGRRLGDAHVARDHGFVDFAAHE